MAILQVGSAAEAFQWIPDLLALEDASDITTMAATELVYVNARGETVTLTGLGFTYSGGEVTGGTISSIVVTNGLAETLLTLSQLNDSLAGYINRLLNEDAFAALEELFKGNDQLNGAAGSDTLGGFSAGDDIVDGKGGGDTIIGDKGKDTLIGGDGWDSLGYFQSYFDTSAKSGLRLDAAKGTVRDCWGDTDTISGFESYVGSKFDDVMIGSSRDEEFAGQAGEDRIDGKGGWDLLDYSKDGEFSKKGNRGVKVDLEKGKIVDGFGHTDQVKNIEAVRGTAKKDVFKAGKNGAEFQGLGGKDSFKGGKGTDQIAFDVNDWNGGLTGVVVDLSKSKGQVINDGYGNKENAKSIEDIRGTKFDDVITGSKAKNHLWGHDGNDKLDGGKGADRLEGGDGNDRLTGGKGADIFIFNTTPDDATNHDFIADFEESQGDRIALWKPDIFSGLSGANGKLAAGEFVANAGGDATTAAHRIAYDTATGNLYFDADGNGVGGKVLIATLSGAPNITVNAFEVWT